MAHEYYCKVSGCRYKHSHVTNGHRCGNCKKYGHGIVECGNDLLIKLLNNRSTNDIFPNNKYCNIENCKFKHLHSSRAHHCKFCGQNHSSKECPTKIGITLEKKYELKCPICKTKNTIGHKFQKVYGCDNTCCICLDNKVEIFLPNCGHVCMCLECLKKMDTNKESINDFKIYHESEISDYVKELVNKKFKTEDGKIYTMEYGGMGCMWYIRRDFKDGSLLAAFLHSDCQGQYGVNHIPYINNFIEDYRIILS